jgi:hypothetical protein
MVAATTKTATKDITKGQLWRQRKRWKRTRGGEGGDAHTKDEYTQALYCVAEATSRY